MAAPQFDLSVLTPERAVFEGRVEYVQVPGSEGYLGVLAGHAALVAELAAGTLTVRESGGDERHWQVSGGFFEVAADRATVLADEVSADEPEAPQG
jgi:F-type H+-transporting ATPase subunit epsilon